MGLSMPTSAPEPLVHPTRRTVLRALLGVGVGVGTGTVAYGFGYERHRIEVTRTALRVPRLPPALDGLRIGLLTDLHRSETVPRDDIEQAVDLLLQERPDLIVLGGDYVTWGDRQFVEDAAESVARLTAPHGVFAVLGNHDDDRDMPRALSRRGLEVLRDARTRITVRGEPLDLAGLRFWTRKEPEIRKILDGASPSTILLAHDPRRLREAAALGVPLVLAGHTHGGQVVIPGFGAPAARKFPVLSGTATEQDTTMYVSRGVGTVYVPIRINCPPEVAMLKLATGAIPGP
jgi:uncharacterized protein